MELFKSDGTPNLEKAGFEKQFFLNFSEFYSIEEEYEARNGVSSENIRAYAKLANLAERFLKDLRVHFLNN